MTFTFARRRRRRRRWALGWALGAGAIAAAGQCRRRRRRRQLDGLVDLAVQDRPVPRSARQTAATVVDGHGPIDRIAHARELVAG